MAAGQDSFAGGFDAPAVRAVEDRIEQRGLDASRLHAGLLRDVLELHSLHQRSGMSLMTPTQVALLLRCSESRAGRLLHEACGLSELSGGFAALETGLLQPEQCLPLVTQLAPLTLPQRRELWQRLIQRLQHNQATGGVLPPARLTELLRTWVIEIAPRDAAERRQRAEEQRRLEYRRREDGLADIFLLGIRVADAHAVLQTIREASAPVTGWDERTADQRRLDAAVDVLLGRDVLGTEGVRCRTRCDCRPGEPAPCGATIVVHVPLDAALGTTDQAAELVGHGPIEPDLLQHLMANNPTLRPLFVDDHGVPVGVGNARQTRRPPGGDEAGLRAALLQLAAMRPSTLFPRDPDDHGPPGAPSALSHPPRAPGPYVVSGLLRKLIFARAPRCEMPGCGVRAANCDAEHDLAHPDGPTCSCNLGPCCRRHHRVKQLGWTKTRHRDGGHPRGPSACCRRSPWRTLSRSSTRASASCFSGCRSMTPRPTSSVGRTASQSSATRTTRIATPGGAMTSMTPTRGCPPRLTPFVRRVHR